MIDPTPHPPRETAFWKRVSRDPDGHWRGDWPVASDGRRLQHTWNGRVNVNPARAAWELTTGESLGNHRLYRKCDEARCVKPDHHATTKIPPDPLKDPEVVRHLIDSLPPRRACGTCGYPLAPAGGCSHCRREKRRRREQYVRAFGGPPPVQTTEQKARQERVYDRPEERPARPRLRVLRSDAWSVEAEESEQQPTLDEIMDDIFGVS